MKHNTLLTVTSLLSVFLFSLHVTDDIVRGFESWGPDKLTFVLILVVWLYGTLVVTERRSGLIIMLLGGVLSLLVLVVHIRGNYAKSSGAFLFLWTLCALGTTGTLSAILAVHGLRGRALGISPAARERSGELMGQ